MDKEGILFDAAVQILWRPLFSRFLDSFFNPLHRGVQCMQGVSRPLIVRHYELVFVGALLKSSAM